MPYFSINKPLDTVFCTPDTVYIKWWGLSTIFFSKIFAFTNFADSKLHTTPYYEIHNYNNTKVSMPTTQNKSHD